MTKDQIMRMSREAGFNWPDIQTTTIEQRLERFVALVAAAEREACAITAWSAGMDAHNAARGLPCDARDVGSKAASAIRTRGNP